MNSNIVFMENDFCSLHPGVKTKYYHISPSTGKISTHCIQCKEEYPDENLIAMPKILKEN